MSLAEGFLKSMMQDIAPASEQKRPDWLIRWYLTTVIKISENYLLLSERATDKREKDMLAWSAKHICEAAEKKLKKKKFISELSDLMPDIRIAFVRTLYVSLFYSHKEKQTKVNDLWEAYSNSRSWPEWLKDDATRNEILCTGMKLMEYMLMGYMPEKITEEGQNKSDYVNTLIWGEGSYMVAKQQEMFTPRTIYERELLRTMFVIDFQEKGMEQAETYRREIRENLKDQLSYWEDSEDPYLLKMQWLLQWHIDTANA